MKITNEELSISDQHTDNGVRRICIDLGIIFEDYEKLEDTEVYKIIASTLINKIKTNIQRDAEIVENTEKIEAALDIEKVPTPTTTKDEEYMALSKSEQKVYDIIQKEAPVGKTSEIVCRWPANKELTPEVAKLILCKTHGEPRVARYSYKTRINPSGKANFWISHQPKIEGLFCEEDIEIDTLVEFLDMVEAS